MYRYWNLALLLGSQTKDITQGKLNFDGEFTKVGFTGLFVRVESSDNLNDSMLKCNITCYHIQFKYWHFQMN